jgi:hypothetical protein
MPHCLNLPHPDIISPVNLNTERGRLILLHFTTLGAAEVTFLS